MALFTNITDLKNYLGGAVTKTLDLQSIAPTLDMAAAQYVVPKIGEATFAFLQTPLEADADTTTVQKTAIGLKLLKTTVAWFGLHEYASIGNVMFGESGLHRLETDSHKSAFKYQEFEFRAQTLRTAWFNLETLLKFLETDPSVFEMYHSSHERERNMAHLLNFATDFQASHSRWIHRVTYEALLPYIADVEEFCVRDFLGQSLFDELREKLYADDAPRKMRDLTRLLQRGIADFALYLALLGNIIQFKGAQVVLVETQRDEGSTQQLTPSMDILAASMNQKREWSDRYFIRAEAFIRDNRETFDTWIGFQASELPDIEAVREKSNLLSVFFPEFYPPLRDVGRLNNL